MKAEVLGLKTVAFLSGTVNYILLTVTVVLITFAGYALWDSNQLHSAADKSNYEVYKPTAENQGISFKELQAINPEVFAWLTVYGTNIDYPVAQGQDNAKYVNTNAEGMYSLSGAIFLDSENSSDFSDFNSILFGHHMAKKVMFGEIETFADSDVFASLRYGNLYYNEKDHGIEFFAFVHADAYNSLVYTPNVQGEQRREYLDNLFALAVNIRDVRVTVDDHIVLLSTCSSSTTNGRDILVGKITDETYDIQATDSPAAGWIRKARPNNNTCFVEATPIWIFLLVLIIAIRLVLFIPIAFLRYRSNRA